MHCYQTYSWLQGWVALWTAADLIAAQLQGPGAQHAAWYRELQCETMLMSVHDNLYKMEEYAIHASAEVYVGTLGTSLLLTS